MIIWQENQLRIIDLNTLLMQTSQNIKSQRDHMVTLCSIIYATLSTTVHLNNLIRDILYRGLIAQKHFPRAIAKLRNIYGNPLYSNGYTLHKQLQWIAQIVRIPLQMSVSLCPS